ncbi:hypothetical protein [Rhizobium lentis]|uniref:Uncharacterized protein n=1 Tax=Rhizobium lentis TaxID=1138194 RepID=A0A7W8XH11_9HYPH|nr:hypothetical protein [Rhizobium lentis]MBB4575763.1 hypothetical protein [Rhizobium lentis]MBB5552174.1 hypothetical protein [Rhizobium lentis]MBB5562712.1 hypothetical protein [Rhizobium lentis]MBB5569741.1 hypothetical protein [Rhizobium lentis]
MDMRRRDESWLQDNIGLFSRTACAKYDRGDVACDGVSEFMQPTLSHDEGAQPRFAVTRLTDGSSYHHKHGARRAPTRV